MLAPAEENAVLSVTTSSTKKQGKKYIIKILFKRKAKLYCQNWTSHVSQLIS